MKKIIISSIIIFLLGIIIEIFLCIQSQNLMVQLNNNSLIHDDQTAGGLGIILTLTFIYGLKMWIAILFLLTIIIIWSIYLIKILIKKKKKGV